MLVMFAERRSRIKTIAILVKHMHNSFSIWLSNIVSNKIEIVNCNHLNQSSHIIFTVSQPQFKLKIDFYQYACSMQYDDVMSQAVFFHN